MATGAAGAYWDTLLANAWPPEPGPLLQNPHIHLLEAALALHYATGGSEARFTYLARAMAS